jgi:hypothetical protein
MAASTVTPSARRAHVRTTGASGNLARNSIAPPETRTQSAAPALEERKSELHVVPAPKRTGLVRGRLVLAAPLLCLVSLLAIAGAQAVLTEGQVRMTNLQAEVSAAQTKRFDLELQVAQEEQPSAVVAAALAQGMIVPSVVNEIPAVNPAPSTSTNPSASTNRTTRSSEAGTNTSKSGATSPRGASGKP